MEDLVRTCTSWHVPEVHPDSPSYNPDSAVARDYSIFLVHGDPEILRKAYNKMQNTKPVGGNRRVRSLVDDFRVDEFPSYDDTWEQFQFQGTIAVRDKRQVAAGFLAVAGVVVVSQWNSSKSALGLGSSDHSLIQAVNEDTRHLRAIRDHVMEDEKVTRSMRSSLAYTKRYETLKDQFDILVSLRQEVFGQYQFLYAGIDQLISSHWLNSALVHPPYAIGALTSLSNSFSKTSQWTYTFTSP